MAQEGIKFKRPPAPVEDPQDYAGYDGSRKTAGTVARVLPTAIRLASGIGPGGLVGAGLGSGGELLAQIIGGEDVNWPRVGVEGAVGAVPFGKFLTKGVKAGAAAGGTLAAGGVVGRKATSKDPEESVNPLTWGAGDVGQIVLGTTMGGVGGKIGSRGPKTAKVPDPVVTTSGGTPLKKIIPSGEPTPGIVPRAGSVIEKVRSPYPAPPEGYSGGGAARSAAKEAAEAKKTADADISQEAKNLNARDKFLENLSKATDKAALKAEADRMKAWIQEAKNLTSAEKAEAAKKAVDEVQRRLDELGPGAKQTTTVSDTVSGVTPEGGKITATTRTSAADDIDDAADAADAGGSKRTSIRTDPPTPRAPRATAVPKVTPKAGEWQIVNPAGKVVASTTTEDEAADLVNAFGQGHIVILPKQAPKTPDAPFNPPKLVVPDAPPATPIDVISPSEVGVTLRGPASTPEVPATPVAPVVSEALTPEQKLARFWELTDKSTAGTLTAAELQEATILNREFRETGFPVLEVTNTPTSSTPDVPPTTPTVAPPVRAGSKEGQLADTTTGTKALEDLEAQLGREIPPPAGGRGTIPVSADAPPTTAPPETPIPSAPTTTSTGAGIDFTRFFRTPEAVRRNLDVQAGMEPEPVRALNNLFAQLDLARDKASRGSIMDKIRAVQKQFGLVSPPKGAPTGQTPPKTVPVAPTAPPSAPTTPTITPPVGRLDTSQEPPITLEAPFRRPTEKSVEDLQREREELINQLTNDGSTRDSVLSGLQKFMSEGSGGEKGEINPELIAQLLGGAVGAGAGSLASEDDPLLGALLGGAAGAYGGGKLAQGTSNMGGAGNLLKEVGHTIPQLARANYLTDPMSLAINTTAAPIGASNMAALERIGTGLIERMSPTRGPITGALEEGQGALRELWNPRSMVGSVKDAFRVANQRISDAAERAEYNTGDRLPNAFERNITQWPGVIMGTGDEVGRSALQRAGFSPQRARAATVTDNPRTGLGEGLIDLVKKGGPVGAMIAPFTRTAVNVVESGLERTPGVALMFREFVQDPALRATFAETAAQQGGGAAVGAAAYLIGLSVDPETVKQYRLHKLIANAAGQYGALASAGLAAGLAAQAGKDIPDQAYTAALSTTQGLPVPSVAPLNELFAAARATAKGEPFRPEAEHWPQQYLPGPLLPSFLKDSVINEVRDDFSLSGPVNSGGVRFNRPQR